MKLGILEQGQQTRPTLLGTVFGGVGGSGTSRTISVTPPAGTTMVVAVVDTLGAASATLNVPTFGGAAMSVGRAHTYFSNSTGPGSTGIYYKTGITAGVATDFVLTGSDAFTSLIRIFCLKDAYTVGAGGEDSATGSDSGVSVTLTIANDYAYVVSGVVASADNNTPGAASFNNGTMTTDDSDSGTKTAYATAYHPNPAAGSQAFTWTQGNNNWIGSNGNGHRMKMTVLDVYG